MKGILALVGAVTLGLVGLGVFEHYKGKKAAAAPGGGGGGGGLDIVLTPGTMSAVSMSLSKDKTLSFTTPQGQAVIGGTSTNAAVMSVTGATATAIASGQTSLVLIWVDANGSNVATLPVTVTA